MMKGKVLMLAMVLMMMSRSEAKTPESGDCINSLMPCASHLKSKEPPAICCDPLREAIANQKDCLCSLFTNSEFLKSLGITANDASTLPTRCNISGASPDLCSSLPSSSSSPGPSPATSTTTSPPATSSKNSGTLVAFTSVSFGLAIFTSFLFY